jgi:hypothetical protein
MPRDINGGPAAPFIRRQPRRREEDAQRTQRRAEVDSITAQAIAEVLAHKGHPQTSPSRTKRQKQTKQKPPVQPKPETLDEALQRGGLDLKDAVRAHDVRRIVLSVEDTAGAIHEMSWCDDFTPTRNGRPV